MNIRAITADSGKIRTLVDEVNAGSQEQSKGIEQVSQALAQIEQVTQRTAANAEESAAASQEMATQSGVLMGVVGQLNKMVYGLSVESERTSTAEARHPTAFAESFRR